MSCSCASPIVKYYPDNSMVVQLGVVDGAVNEPLHNEIDGTVITAATVTCTIQTKAGVAVAGPSWPASMPHSSLGQYLGTLAPIAALKKGTLYDVKITATYSGVTGVWTVEVEGWNRAA